MKAAVHTRYGPPDVVRVADVEVPSIGDGELLVRVHAGTVNRTDCAYRAARPFFVRTSTGLFRPKRTILGTEFAGVVEAVGTGVTGFSVGDRVFGYNEGRFGTHAELLSISASAAIAHMPPGMRFDELAPATEGAHYALAIMRKDRIRAGQEVLVHGATGAIGSAAVQLLTDAGVTVTATCDTAHIELVKGLGAVRVIDHTAEDFTQDDHRYDAVIDAVGKSTFRRCRRVLKPRGRYLSSELGPWWQNIVLALVTPLLGGKSVRFAIPTQNQEMVRHLSDLVEAGRFKPVIDRHYPLDQIVDAYRYVETGQKVGNVVLDIAGPSVTSHAG